MSKTIRQLWEENGAQPGLLVRHEDWTSNESFCVVAISPKSKALGWYKDGTHETYGVDYVGWELIDVIELEEKPKTPLVLLTLRAEQARLDDLYNLTMELAEFVGAVDVRTDIYLRSRSK